MPRPILRNAPHRLRVAGSGSISVAWSPSIFRETASTATVLLVDAVSGSSASRMAPAGWTGSALWTADGT